MFIRLNFLLRILKYYIWIKYKKSNNMSLQDIINIKDKDNIRIYVYEQIINQKNYHELYNSQKNKK